MLSNTIIHIAFPGYNLAMGFARGVEMNRLTVFSVISVLAVTLHGAAHAQRCNNTSVGFTPINDLGAGVYRGWQGGLYPGGFNERPTDHQAAGELLASQIQPLDLNGQPDPVGGKIVLLAIGMSNSWQEFSALKLLINDFGPRNQKMIVVNGAQPGKDIDQILEFGGEYWFNIRDSLAEQGVSNLQVQAIWFKQAEAFPAFDGNDTTFHGYVDSLKAKFLTAITIARAKFPNAKVCYMASRTYGGYADFQLNPEPFAYYTGWTVKRLIEDQINGAPELSYAEPDPLAPWLSWGLYMWADGLIPRSDGLIWECSDFQPDGTHPSETGETKVATALLNFFATDATTRPWFLEGTSTDVTDDPAVPLSYSISNYPNPFNPQTTIRFELPVADHVRVTILDVSGQVVAGILDKSLPAGTHEVVFDASELGSGVYFYHLQSRNSTLTGKMLLIR